MSDTRFTFLTTGYSESEDETETTTVCRLLIEHSWNGGKTWQPNDDVGTTSSILWNLTPNLTFAEPPKPQWPGLNTESFFRRWAKVFFPWQGPNQLKYFKQVGHGQVEWAVCKPSDHSYAD